MLADTLPDRRLLVIVAPAPNVPQKPCHPPPSQAQQPWRSRALMSKPRSPSHAAARTADHRWRGWHRRFVTPGRLTPGRLDRVRRTPVQLAPLSGARVLDPSPKAAALFRRLSRGARRRGWRRCQRRSGTLPAASTRSDAAPPNWSSLMRCYLKPGSSAASWCSSEPAVSARTHAVPACQKARSWLEPDAWISPKAGIPPVPRPLAELAAAGKKATAAAYVTRSGGA